MNPATLFLCVTAAVFSASPDTLSSSLDEVAPKDAVRARGLQHLLNTLDSQCSYDIERVDVEFKFEVEAERDAAMEAVASMARTGTSPADLWIASTGDALDMLGAASHAQRHEKFQGLDAPAQKLGRYRVTQTPRGILSSPLGSTDPFVRLRLAHEEVTYDRNRKSLVVSKPSPLEIWSLEDVFQPIPIGAESKELLASRTPHGSEGATSTTQPLHMRWSGADWSFWSHRGMPLATVEVRALSSDVPAYLARIVIAPGGARSQALFVKHAFLAQRLPNGVLRLTALAFANVDFHVGRSLRVEVDDATYLWDIRNDKHVFLSQKRSVWPSSALNAIRNGGAK